MKNLVVFCLITLFSCCCTQPTFAAYPIKQTAATNVPAAITDKHVSKLEKPAARNGHLSFFRKMKMMLPHSDHHFYPGEKSEKYGLSLLSGIFGVIAYVGLYAGFILTLLSGAGSFFPFLLGACALGVAAFILGIIALKLHQKYRGLAITGIIIGSGFVAILLYLFIAWGLGVSFAGF